MRRTPLLPLLLAGIAFGGFAAPGVASEPILVDAGGTWGLKSLGSRSFSLRPGGATVNRRIHFRLPASAAHDGDPWYLLRLDARIVLRRAGGKDSALLSASTNGHSAAQVDIDRVGRRTRWSTVDLIRGPKSGTSRSQEIQVSFKNYLPVHGVKPGRNALMFKLESFGGRPVERVEILPQSGLVVSKLAPAHLRLEPVFPEGQLHVGDKFDLKVTLVNDGDRPAVGAGAMVLPASHDSDGAPVVLPGQRLKWHGLEVLGPERIRLGKIRRAATATFRMRATSEGHHRIEIIGGADNTNDPGVTVDVDVDPPTLFMTSGPFMFAGGAGIVLGGAAVMWLRKRRRRITRFSLSRARDVGSELT